jgi:hypothetical protein
MLHLVMTKTFEMPDSEMPDMAAGEFDDWELLLVLRRCVLLVCTWLAAHIFNLLHDIAFATRMQFVSDGTPVPEGDGEAAEKGGQERGDRQPDEVGTEGDQDRHGART